MSAPSARLRAWRVPLAVGTLGLALVLPRLSGLGLWNDDVVQFLQPHHAAAGDTLAFLFGDGTGFLSGGERPVGYLVYVVARLAYLAGVPWLHLLAVAAAALAAAVFARFHRRLLADEASALVAGALVLLWPLAPLTLFWPSALHFTVAATLSLAAAELALSERPRRRPFASVTHLLACLTLEEFVLAAPAWTLAALASERLRLVPPAAAGRRRALRPLAAMMAVSAAVLAWRLFGAPALGLGRLSYQEQLPGLATALAQEAAAPAALLWPWPRALAVARRVWPEAPPLAWPLALAAAVTLLALLLGRTRPAADAVRGDPARSAAGPWRALGALLPGAALLLFWSAQLAFVPGAFADPVGLASRLTYPAKFGVAAALAGLYFLLATAARGRWRLAGLAIAHGLLALALTAGGHFERRVLRAHENDWRVSAGRMEQIAAACGGLAPGTLVIVDTRWPTTLLRAGRIGMSHEVVSSLLIARYDDPTLRGVRLAELRATRRGVRPLHFRAPVRWFPPGEYGSIQSRARQVAPPVAVDRLVTLAPGPAGRLVAVRALKVPLGHRRVRLLRHRPERCRPGRTAPSPAFCHALPRLCRGGEGMRGRRSAAVAPDLPRRRPRPLPELVEERRN